MIIRAFRHSSAVHPCPFPLKGVLGGAHAPDCSLRSPTLQSNPMSRPSDIIVVGAGVIGCAVAYELARRGASVEIVDDRPVGMGATQASAGVLAPYIEAPAAGPVLDLTERSLDLFDDFVARVSTESGFAVPYRRTGTLEVALDEAGLLALRKASDVLASRGVPALLLDAAAARTEEPHLADGVTGGLLIDTHGFVGAGDLTRAL